MNLAILRIRSEEFRDRSYLLWQCCKKPVIASGSYIQQAAIAWPQKYTPIYFDPPIFQSLPWNEKTQERKKSKKTLPNQGECQSLPGLQQQGSAADMRQMSHLPLEIHSDLEKAWDDWCWAFGFGPWTSDEFPTCKGRFSKIPLRTLENSEKNWQR